MPGNPLAGGFRSARQSLYRAPNGATSGRDHLEASTNANAPPEVNAALPNRGLQGRVEAVLRQGIRPLSSKLMITWGAAIDLLLGFAWNASPSWRWLTPFAEFGEGGGNAARAVIGVNSFSSDWLS
jgi:hypothetical protein